MPKKRKGKRQGKKVSIQHYLPVKISQHLGIGKSGQARLPDGQGVCSGDSCNKFWAKRVCGPASLAMVIAYYFSKNELSVVEAVDKVFERGENNSLKKLSEFLVDFIISDGVKNKAYIENIGWLHQGLIDTAAKHFGLSGNRFDFAKESGETAFEKMIEDLKNGPVIASIYKNLNPQNGGHLVVVFGVDDNNILFADPDIDNLNLIERRATKEEFKNGWKKRFIVIRPKLS